MLERFLLPVLWQKEKRVQIFVSGFLFLGSYSAAEWEINIGFCPVIVNIWWSFCVRERFDQYGWDLLEEVHC